MQPVAPSWPASREGRGLNHGWTCCLAQHRHDAPSERAQAANVAISVACRALSGRSTAVARLHDHHLQTMVQHMAACDPPLPVHVGLDFRHPGRDRVGWFCSC